MPRFGMKSMLIAFAVVAVWLSTIGGNYAGQDVRAFIMLTIALVSLLGVIYYRRQRRAFWIGFFITIMAIGIGMETGKATCYIPQFYSVDELLFRFGMKPDLGSDQRNPTFYFYADTARAVITILLAIFVGYLGTQIYEHSEQVEKE